MHRALAAFSPEFVPLRPFADDDLSELAETVTGKRPTADGLAALRSVRTNPFLVSMLAASAVAQPSSAGRDAPLLVTHDAFRRMAASLDPVAPLLNAP